MNVCVAVGAAPARSSPAGSVVLHISSVNPASSPQLAIQRLKVGQHEGKAGPRGNAGTRGRGCQLMGQEGEGKARAVFLKRGDFPGF